MKILRPCDVCNNDDAATFKVMYMVHGAEVVRCAKCDFVYVNNEILNRHDDKMHTYEDSYTVNLHERHKILSKAAEDRYERIRRYLGHGQKIKILDVGCSIGYFLKIAKDAGDEVMGIEANKKSAEYAKEHYDVPVLLTGDIFHSSYPELLNTFDVVTLFNVIEHLSHPSRFIERLSLFLKPGGKLIIETPTEDALIRRILHLTKPLLGNRMAGYFYHTEVGKHTVCFSRKSMQRLLRNNGFSMDKCDYVSVGSEYMTKSFKGFKKAMFRGCGEVLMILSHLARRPNHMMAYATRKDE